MQATQNEARDYLPIPIENSMGSIKTTIHGCQIDLYAELVTKKGKRSQKTAFLAEIKDRHSKVGITDSNKFLRTLSLAKKQYKLKKMNAVYISSSGFSKTAQSLLESNGILCGTSEAILGSN
jgi:3,4-dihydroxy-2-butanone 4-phosphate synthase